MKSSVTPTRREGMVNDDVVKRLRSDWYGRPSDAVLDSLCCEAANEITRLRAALASANKSIEVFQEGNRQLRAALAEAEREREWHKQRADREAAESDVQCEARQEAEADLA